MRAVWLTAFGMSLVACGGDEADVSDGGARGYPGTFEECVTDVWTFGSGECYCPSDAPRLSTDECGEGDCVETDLLALLADERSFEILVRWSDGLGQISSPHAPNESMWMLDASNDLVLDYGSHELITPATCDAEHLEREFSDGRPHRHTRATPVLAEAVRRAYETGDWDGVPLAP